MTLEMDVKDVAGIVIEGMKGHAEELGLTGTEYRQTVKHFRQVRNCSLIN